MDPTDELELDTREFDRNPESGHVAIVHRSFQDIERKEIEEELDEAEDALKELVSREDAATTARKEGDRRVAALKSELEGFDEIAQRTGADTGPTGDGGANPAGVEESDEAVAL